MLGFRHQHGHLGLAHVGRQHGGIDVVHLDVVFGGGGNDAVLRVLAAPHDVGGVGRPAGERVHVVEGRLLAEALSRRYLAYALSTNSHYGAGADAFHW